MSTNQNKKVLNVIEDLSLLTNWEQKLSHFFKCASQTKMCPYTSNSFINFIGHIHTYHPKEKLVCMYCVEPNEEKISYSGPDLIKHLLYEHPFRLYQCNLCLYRATRVIHLLVHHMTCHTPNFFSTVNKLEDSTPESKVIKCKQIIEGPRTNEDIFFLHSRSKRINKTNKKHFQCLFCGYVTPIQDKVFIHISQFHPDLPFCYFDPSDDIWEDNERKQRFQASGTDIESLSQNLKSSSLTEESLGYLYDPPVQPFEEVTNDFAADSRRLSLEELQKDLDLSESEDEHEDTHSPNDEEIVKPQFKSNKRLSQVDASKKIPLTTPRKRFFEEQIEEEEHIPLPRIGRKNERSLKFYSTPTAPMLVKKIYKCLACKTFNIKNTLQHLREIHKTDVSTKCSLCDFIGGRREITIHIKTQHTDKSANVLQFIVQMDQAEGNNLGGPSKSSNVENKTQKARKTQKMHKVNKHSKSNKPTNLMEAIKGTTYIGPLKDQVTSFFEQSIDKNVRLIEAGPHSSSSEDEESEKESEGKEYEESEDYEEGLGENDNQKRYRVNQNNEEEEDEIQMIEPPPKEAPLLIDLEEEDDNEEYTKIDCIVNNIVKIKEEKEEEEKGEESLMDLERFLQGMDS